MTDPRRRAAFLDRDGTVIVERDHLADAALVELIPGTIDALRLLQRLDYAIVIVTNQSGIARGLFTEADFRAIQTRLQALLRADGIELDAVYHCPHHPDITGPCECRKPGLGMYRQAAAELDLDLAGSVCIGDRLRDVQPALSMGATGILVETGHGRSELQSLPNGILTAPDLAGAVRLLTGQS